MNRLCLFGLLVIFLFVGAGYSSHIISSETRLNISGVFGGADEGRNWTGANANEIVNFTIVNDGGSNDSVVSVNVTMNSAFTLINTTISVSPGNWNCSNTSLIRVDCFNASGLGLANGSSMYIWFNVTASDSVVTEESYSWTINTLDSAGDSNDTILHSSIDGKVTEAASVDTLEAYVNSQPVVLNWTNHSGCDNVSEVLNYTVYNSTDGVNFKVYATTYDTDCGVTGLEDNHVHYFKVEIQDNAGNAANSSVVSTIIDTDAPVVELNTMDNANFTDTYYPRLYFNATDNFDTNMSCEVFVEEYHNGTGHIINATPGLSIQVNSSLIGEDIEWYVNCTDDAGNVGKSTTRTLNVVGADIKIMRVNFSSPDATITYSSNLTVFATVKNVGNRNITKNITVTFYLDGTSIGDAEKILNETLTAGQEVMVNITRTGGLKEYSPALNHTLKAFASVNSATELNSTNNYAYNYSLYVGYNVTITSIDSTRTPGANQTINVMVSYPNGTGVTGIDVRNFTIDDMYSGQSTHTWGGAGLTYQTGTGWTGQNTYNDSFNEIGSGQYTFKIGTYNLTSISGSAATRHGAHTVRVDIESNMTGRYFKGRGEDEYNLTAPTFDIIYKVKGSSTDLGGSADQAESSSEDYNLYIVNNGHYANLTSVNISVSSYDSVFSSVTAHNCSSQRLVASDGSEVLVCYISVVTAALDSSNFGLINIEAVGIYGNRYTYSGDNLRIDVADGTTTSTDTTTTSDTTTTTTSDTDYPNCAEDDDCFGDEYCNIHLVCKELDCADDEMILDHACVKKDGDAAQIDEYSLGITGAPELLEIEHGEVRNVTFKVKNTGEKALSDFSFVLEIADVSGWYDVISNHSTTLESGDVESVKVEVNTANLSIGVYDVVALAQSSDADANISFKLRVTPNDGEKIVINDTINKLNSDYAEIYDQMQVLLHDMANNTNLTALNDTLFEVAGYLESAKAAIDREDYLSAYENQKSAESLMIEIRAGIDEGNFKGADKESHLLRNGFIAVIFLIAGIFGFQYYREQAQVTSGYHPACGFRLGKSKRSFNGRVVMKEISAVKGLFKGKKRSEKQSVNPAFGYSYGKGTVSYNSKKESSGVFSKICGMFRSHKRDATTQKTLYDISSVYSSKNRKKSKKLKVRCL